MCAPNKLFESLAAKLPIAYTGSLDLTLLKDVHQIVSKMKTGAPINFLDARTAARQLNNFVLIWNFILKAMRVINLPS